MWVYIDRIFWTEESENPNIINWEQQTKFDEADCRQLTMTTISKKSTDGRDWNKHVPQGSITSYTLKERWIYDVIENTTKTWPNYQPTIQSSSWLLLIRTSHTYFSVESGTDDSSTVSLPSSDSAQASFGFEWWCLCVGGIALTLSATLNSFNTMHSASALRIGCLSETVCNYFVVIPIWSSIMQ